MFKITFLVGNGFDVNLGIKTSYYNFYEWYLKQKNNSEIIKQFKQEIANEIKDKNIPESERTWADFETGMGKYTSKFTPETVEDFLDCYEDAQESIVKYLKEQLDSFDVDKIPKAELEK